MRAGILSFERCRSGRQVFVVVDGKSLTAAVELRCRTSRFAREACSCVGSVCNTSKIFSRQFPRASLPHLPVTRPLASPTKLFRTTWHHLQTPRNRRRSKSMKPQRVLAIEDVPQDQKTLCLRDDPDRRPSSATYP